MLTAPLGLLIFIFSTIVNELKRAVESDRSAVESFILGFGGIGLFFILLIAGFMYAMFGLKYKLVDIFWRSPNWGPARRRDRGPWISSHFKYMFTPGAKKRRNGEETKRSETKSVDTLLSTTEVEIP